MSHQFLTDTYETERPRTDVIAHWLRGWRGDRVWTRLERRLCVES